MIERIKVALARVVANHAVRSAVRHAATAAGGVLMVAVLAGGVHAVSTGVLIAAGAAALRVLELAAVAYAKRYLARRKAA